MKKQIHTSPVAEAFLARTECPFCHLEKDAQQRSINFFAGSCASYMEPSIRGITNRLGFCGNHLKQLYDYGNVLGNALMLQSHMEHILLELQDMSKPQPQPEKPRWFQNRANKRNTPAEHFQQRVKSCAICQQVEESMDRNYQVFFSLLSDTEFRQFVEESNGFCLRHYARLLQEADTQLPHKYAQWFYPAVNDVMHRNWARVKADLDILIAKHDYRNTDLDWSNARDSVPRAMQKLAGIHPTDPPYKKN